MQIREWQLGVAVLVATVAFGIALTSSFGIQAPQRGMQPPLVVLHR